MGHAPDPSTVDQFFGLVHFAFYIALTFAALWLIVKIFPSIGTKLSALFDAMMGETEDTNAPESMPRHMFHRPENKSTINRWM